VPRHNGKRADRAFADYARHVWGDGPRGGSAAAPTDEEEQQDAAGGSAAPHGGGPEVAPHPGPRAEEAVARELGAAAGALSLWDGVLSGWAMGAAVPPPLRRAMLARAVFLHSSTAYARAAKAAAVVDASAALAAAAGDCAAAGVAMVGLIHDDFERARANRRREAEEDERALRRAKRMALASDVAAFAGRAMVLTPTRGGGVYLRLVGLLAQGRVDGWAVPHVAEKIRIIMTGRTRLAEGGTQRVVLGGGESWISCPLDLAGQLRDVVGEDEWIGIENSMRGRSGWVYRPSDIPNRHGYHNSNPNPALSWDFRGFGLPRAR